jgi:hypothetical protein
MSTPATHELKTWPEYFEAVARGEKTFEVRKNDRGFTKGDLLILRKWLPDADGAGVYLTPESEHTAVPQCAASIMARVTYVLDGWGLSPGYVALGLRFEEPTP